MPTQRERYPAGGPGGSQLGELTRRQLQDLEKKEKTGAQKLLDVVIVLLPLLCGGIALLEYLLVPDNSMNQEFTGESLHKVVEKYIRLGLIDKMDDVDEVMALAWTPVL